MIEKGSQFGTLVLCFQLTGSFKCFFTRSPLDLCETKDFLHSNLIAKQWKDPTMFKGLCFIKSETSGLLHFWHRSLLPFSTMKGMTSLLHYLCNLILNSFFFRKSQVKCSFSSLQSFSITHCFKEVIYSWENTFSGGVLPLVTQKKKSSFSRTSLLKHNLFQIQ